MSTWSNLNLRDLGEVEVKHGVRVHIFNLNTDYAGNKELPHKVEAARHLAIARKRRKLSLLTGAVIVMIGIVALGLHRRFRPTSHAQQRMAAAAKGRRSVAVLGFKNLSGAPQAAWLSTAFAEMLTSELGAGGQLRTIPGEEVARTKIDLSLPDTDTLAEDTLARVYRNLGSDLVVLGSYLNWAGQVRLDVHLEDVTKGESLATISETGSEDQLLELVSRTGAELREKCGVAKVTVQQANEIRALTPSNPEAARQYAEGLAKLRSFEDVAARDLLEKAVAAEPNFSLSHAALSKAWGGLGYDAKARDEAKIAFDLSDNLSRDDRLWVEGRYRQTTHEWGKAVDVYQRLYQAYPDNLEYGLALANAQTGSGNGREALVTIGKLRGLPHPVGDNPRIGLAESSAAFDLGDFKHARAAAVQAAENAKEQGAGLVAAVALDMQCNAFERLGQMDEAIAACQEAQAVYASAGDREGVATELQGLAIVFYDRGDNAKATAKYAEARSIYRQIGNVLGEAGASADIGNVLILTGDLHSAAEILKGAASLYEKAGDQARAALVLNSVSYASEALGDLAGAQSFGERALGLARAIGSRDTEGEALSFLSDVAYDRGDLPAYKRLFEQAEAIFRETGNKRRLSGVLGLWGQLLLAEDDLNGAQEKYTQELTLDREMGDTGDAAGVQVAAANVMLEKRSLAGVDQSLRQAISVFRSEKAIDEEISAHAVLAQALLLAGKPSDALNEIRSTKPLIAQTQNPTTTWDLSLIEGRVESSLSNSANANKNLQFVLIQADKLGFVPYSFEARLALGEVEMQSANTSAGRSRLQALEKDAKAKGFLLIARKAATASLAK